MSITNSPRQTRRPAAARRGSVLLMVVAVLALLAIIAVAYTTLGRADRAASASLVRESRLDDQAASIKDYLASVIADDVLATYAERRGDGNWAIRREGTDAPGTSEWLTSDETLLPDGAARFTPSGTYSGPWIGGRKDERRPCDPFLASIEPEYIPEFGATLPGGAFNLAQMDDWRSWRAISNFAPDGRFINLVNLRGNFNAQPGFSAGAPWRMSSRLNLLDSSDAATNTNAITNFTVDQFNRLPADYSTNQFRAFRAMFDNLPPEDPEHINNQWADADGDGFADSRWFELVDGFFINAPRWLLPQAGRARMVIAARAIDLSGLININTAGDFYYEPRAMVNASGQLLHYPAGLTPADIDLRRFLGMGDMTWVFRNGSGEFGYNEFEQPAGGVADYSGYDAMLAINIGNSAYAAIRYAINTGEVLPADAIRGTPAGALLEPNANENTLTPGNPNPLTDELRARLYEEFGADPASARNRAVGGAFVYRAPFGLADELELRTFSGVNDSDHLSSLERIAGGREDARYGPMRENRPRAVEMTGRPDSASGLASDEALLSVFADIRHLMTTQNGGRTIVDNPLAIVNPSSLNNQEYKTDMVALLSRVEQPLVTPVTSADIQAIFDLYAGSLVPYTDEVLYPDAWDRSDMRSRGLSYGESAELAQRISAHIAANLIDAVDRDVPAAATYDLATPTRICLEAVIGAPNDPDFEQTNVVALRDPRRPDVSESNLYVGPARLNIYGIEAQPFLIEVGWFGVFTDTPVGATNGSSDAPDDEWSLHTDDGGVPPLITALAPVTIDDRPSPTNSDFMFEVLAFQLTNPFDRPLRISSGGQVSYYVEYSNRFFALAKRSDDGMTIDAADVEIAPYDTKVFYVANIKDPQDIAARLVASRYTPPGATPAVIVRDYIDLWARQQFGASAVPITMVHRKTFNVVDVAGGTGGGSAEYVDLFAETTIPAGGPGEPAQGMISTPPSSAELRKVANLWRVFRPAAATDPAGDILLDRIRDPDATLNGTIGEYRDGTGNMDVPNSLGGDDTDADPDNDKDNTGFSITKWAGFRRPNNETGVPYQRGSMPPWCIEAKAINEYPATALNQAYDEPLGDIGDAADYRDNTQDDRRRSLESLLVAQRSTVTVNSQIRTKAESKVGNAIPVNQSMPAKMFNEVAVEVHLGGGTSNPQLFSRAGDFLLPLGIGPSYNPLVMAAQPTRAQGLEKSWMTLSEALALSCDYYSPTFVEDPLLYRLGHSDAATPIRPRLDRGNLVLTDFAPYLDLGGTAGAFDLDVDEPLGRGIPLALNVLDMVNTTDRWKLDATGNLVRRTQAHGGPRTRISGQVNANTAPVSVMRMIPMFAPDTDPGSWARLGTGPDLLYNPASETFDVAATAVAYRDKTILTPRPFGGIGMLPVLNFRDDNDSNAGTYDGRFAQSGIAAIREQPGFKSVGEIMALRVRNLTNGDRLYDNSIDRFADTGTPTKQTKKSLESSLWKDATGNYDVDEMLNDYDEQLAIANAAMNSLSVRSDVFCVWFLIHGYLPSDVDNLGPNDPMIPSIARRYVMVVDRSNVTQLGQKPQILLFQEVPIR